MKNLFVFAYSIRQLFPDTYFDVNFTHMIENEIEINIFDDLCFFFSSWNKTIKGYGGLLPAVMLV